jgi:sortase A
VVHYADTALPGYDGNVAIVGHSSNNIFNKGKYKFAFVLLSRLEPGDTFYLQKGGKRYTYEVYQKKIVKPNDVSVLQPSDRPATATLITCDPPGTSINRLVITGEQISPSPSKNKPLQAKGQLASQTKVIPSNSESLWSRLWGLLGR